MKKKKMRMRENKGSDTENNNVIVIQRINGLDNSKEGVEGGGSSTNDIGIHCKGVVPNKERDPYDDSFAQLNEVEDGSDEGNEAKEATEEEEDYDNNNGKYRVVDDIELTLESFHSKKLDNPRFN